MPARVVDIETASGIPVRLRVASHDDADALRAGFERLGEASRYQRFFTAMPRLDDALVETLTTFDGRTRMAIGAFDPGVPSEVGTDDGLGIGVARFIAGAADRNCAELAITVADDYQRHGVGRVLLEALVVGALHAGLVSLYGYVLADNTGMIGLFRRLGGRDQHVERPEPGIRRMAIDLDAAVTAMGPRRRVYEQLFR